MYHPYKTVILLLQNDTLAVVIVMSNDRITPLDVTTKDDLFYEVKCRYPDFDESNQHTNIHSGLVVGGPDPRSVFSSLDRPTTQKGSVVLKITKDGRAVENVFIGEKLTAVVESDIEPDRLRVIDCNASRIGGTGPQPNSIKLISQGCALMPQIMGRVESVSQRLEAPLTAFRIDGSDQIEIACSVLICKEKCIQKSDICESKRMRRSNGNNEDAVTIDRRLRVYVDGDPKGFPTSNNDLCVSLWIYAGTVAFLAFLLCVVISLACIRSKRQRRDLHMESINTASDCLGSQYYKTIDSLPKLEPTLSNAHCAD
ncbi:hypothetical protein Tcan_16738 [Toxocara canis]|uniref:ZP domain-containing protein n=1 Tax=Toxocara canis TaxID=6265 RepID=A0A0B2V1J0_TOXCA|nr:hypothetical protein Tcan_16738 [Toxocara canis]